MFLSFVYTVSLYYWKFTFCFTDKSRCLTCRRVASGRRAFEPVKENKSV